MQHNLSPSDTSNALSSNKTNVRHISGSHDNISLACINVRSLLCHIDELSVIVSKHQFDIIAINETWLDSTVSDLECSIEGYNLLRRDRNRHGGGVLFYLKDNITYSEWPDLNINNVECLYIEVTVPKLKPFIVCTMYRPPSANVTYFEDMVNSIENVIDSNDNLILLGDLNYDYCIDETLCNNPIQYIQQLFSMSQLITSPTRITECTSTTIDLILTTMPDLHLSSRVIPSTFSDHYIVCLLYTSDAADE